MRVDYHTCFRRSRWRKLVTEASDYRESSTAKVRSFLFVLRVPPHPVLDVVVDVCPELGRRDEVQLLIREPVVRRQHLVDFVEDGLGLRKSFVTSTKNDAPPLFLCILRTTEIEH